MVAKPFGLIITDTSPLFPVVLAGSMNMLPWLGPQLARPPFVRPVKEMR